MTAGRAVVALCLVALSVGGCVSHRTIAAQAVNYNLAVERAHNETLLLNVLRASHRLPMYFTAIGNVTSDLKLSASTGFAIPFGGDASDAYSATPSASYSVNPTFNIAVLDSEKFVRGILSQVSFETLHHFWHQGWPPEQLLMVVLEKVEKRDASGTITDTWDNDPDSPVEFSRFQTKLRMLIDLGLTIEKVTSPEPIGPRLGQMEVKDLGQLVGVDQAGLALHETPDGHFQLRKSRSDYRFGLEKDEASRIYVQDQVDEGAPGPYYVIVLRSPHGILYYLGEIARQIRKTGNPPTLMTGEPLFVVRAAARCRSAYVAVEYEDEAYVIPKRMEGEPECEPGRSMQILSLASQLLALQKSAEELPSTAVVRVIGQ